MGVKLAMVTFDCDDPQRLGEFWAAALDTNVAADYGEFVFLQAPSGQQITLGFQKVPESRVGKNRVHIDLSGKDRATEVSRLVELGARVLYDQIGTVPGMDWTTLADPEGNEFCVGGPPEEG